MQVTGVANRPQKTSANKVYAIEQNYKPEQFCIHYRIQNIQLLLRTLREYSMMKDSIDITSLNNTTAQLAQHTLKL
jgi:hypothetical protein